MLSHTDLSDSFQRCSNLLNLILFWELLLKNSEHFQTIETFEEIESSTLNGRLEGKRDQIYTLVATLVEMAVLLL